MKKLLVVLLAATLLSVTSIAARAAALESGGEIRVRGWWRDNYLKDETSHEFWDQRLRLGLNWPVAERVRVQARADILGGAWGGEDHISRQAIVFDWANLQFVWPGTPLLVSVGRQDVSWGTGFWVQADNRDRFQVAAKLDPVVIVFAYDKFTEVFADHGTWDDQRGWAVGAVADAVGFRFGLIAAYLKDESRLRFPAGDLRYAAGDFFATGRIGPAELRAEVACGSGTIDRDAPLGDLDASGLGGYAGLFLPLGPLVTLGLEGAYARGDDPETASKNEGFFAADYQGPYWSVIFYNNYDHSGYASDSQSSSTDLDFSVRNAITGKFSVACTPTKNISVTAAGLYAAADQTRDGVANAMGWEFDLVAVYGITGNVSLTAGIGYALLGDYWKSATIAVGGGKPDNPLSGMIAFTTRF